MKILNIDWLEVYCVEPLDTPLTADYFKEQGNDVEERKYGTPIYQEMFTIKRDGRPYIEVRRNPYSKMSQGGIMLDNACHIRLANETCYDENPIEQLRLFLMAYNYRYMSISRIDICLDFNSFDNGWSVDRFINSYMKSHISKVNQTNVSCHGSDSWGCRSFNSLKWGSPSSPISTKLYNKTLEMKQGEDKSYIREWWTTSDAEPSEICNNDKQCGLDLSKDVWRIEFSIKSQAQARQKNGNTQEKFSLHLFDYDTKEKLWMRFMELYSQYFDFRRREYTTDRKTGKHKIKRKYDCKRIVLFDFADNNLRYKPCRKPRLKKRPDRIYKIMINRLTNELKKPVTHREYREAFETLIGYLTYKCNLEVVGVKFREEEELLKLESYRNRLSEYEKECKKMQKEEHEKLMLNYLMNKYGIIPQPQGCPF